MSMKTTLILAITFAATLLAGQSQAAGLEKFHFLKVAVREQKAVLKTPEGEMRLIGIGDTVAGAEVTEIAEGRIVLKEGEDKVIVRLKDGGQELQKISIAVLSPLAIPQQ